MHKSFYASGFLFQPQAQQILLRQLSTSESPSLFTGECLSDETPVQTFQRVIKEQLVIDLPEDKIFQIYSYTHQESKKLYYVFYAEILIEPSETDDSELPNSSWHNFKKLYKSKLDKGLLQDLVVGQRVINAALRVNL